MTEKVVSLTVHKNTVEKRRRKEVRDDLKMAAKQIEMQEMDGFVLVLFSKDGSTVTYWNTKNLGVQSSLRGDICKAAIDRERNMLDVRNILSEDDE